MAVVATVVGVTLTGSCGGGGSSARPDPRQPGDSTATLADSEPRFAYAVGGGFNGEGGDGVTITSAGEVTRTSPYEPLPDTWTISASQVTQLTTLFNRLGFLRMRTTPDLYPRCPDAFTYSVSYRFRGRMNTVTGDQGGEQKHRFWKCLSALGAVVGEHSRSIGEETLVDPPARIDSITLDGKPVTRGSTVTVDSRYPHRISWRGVGKEGCQVTGFSIAFWRGWEMGSLFGWAADCPDGNCDYTFRDSGFAYCVTPVVHFGDKAMAWAEFLVQPARERPRPAPDSVTAKPQPRRQRMTLSKQNRVGNITIDGRPVAPGETVRVEGGRSYRISWQGICADGCKVTRLSVAVRDGYYGPFIKLANSCPDGYYDYRFPRHKRVLWLTPRADFTDNTYAWEGFYVIARDRP